MAQINKPDTYFNTVLWTGDGTTKNITGVGFQPDLVWAKKRSATGFHAWCDSVRGGTKNIFSNSSGAEETNATDWILSFASDGFGVNSAGNLNQSAATYAGWNWLADNTSGSSNTDGSITSTVSVNTTSGFSIVSYAGSASNVTVGHGLGVTPKMIIFKNRTSTSSWTVYHESLGNTNRLILNSSNAQESTNQFSFGTSPTSSVFALGGGYNDVCTSGADYIAYCFAEKKGFSKFGSYTGNGSADGTFVYTGFKPAFLMIKNLSTATTDWTICDSKRDGFNDNNHRLFANTSGAESTSNPWEMYSNGFKMTTTGSFVNQSGDSYIYMAFAENPLVGTNNIPATAR